jgi:tRNA A22 N-methylase
MTLPRLPARLRLLLDLLPACAAVADVGAGPGALAVHLAARDGVDRVIATEARRGPYDELCRNLDAWGARAAVEPRFGADLDPIAADEVEGVVAAGMGARNLLRIGAGAAARRVAWVALQCIQDAELVEPWLAAQRWPVLASCVAIDRGHRYPTWLARVAPVPAAVP